MTGKKITNHSLRASGTSELFMKGVPEKIIQERTGHKSLDALRCYERTTSSQIEAVSNVLNAQSDDTSFSLEMRKHEKYTEMHTPKKSLKRSQPPQYLFNNCKVAIIQGVDDFNFDSFISEHLDLLP